MATVVSFQYRNSEPLPKALSCTKSIRWQDNGFCLALFHAESKTVYLLEQHEFEGEPTLKERIAFLQDVEKKFEASQSFLIVSTRINTQVPAQLHDERNMDLYLPLLTQNPYQYHVFAEPVEKYSLYNVSGLDLELYQQFKSYFPQYKLKSKMSVLLGQLSILEGDMKMLLFWEKNYMYLAAAKGDQLLGANGFAFNGKNDFLYFSVGFAQTMFGGLDGVRLYLAGNIESTSLLYSSLQKYFGQICFANAGYAVLQHQIHRFCDLL